MSLTSLILVGMLAFVGWDSEFQREEVILQLYKALVRIHLEHACSFGCPHKIKDKEAMKGAQRTFTKVAFYYIYQNST